MRKAEVEEIDATNDAIFMGGSVSRRRLVNEDLSEMFAFNIVSFGPGGRNRLHTHTRRPGALRYGGRWVRRHRGRDGNGVRGRHGVHTRRRKALARGDGELELLARRASFADEQDHDPRVGRASQSPQPFFPLTRHDRAKGTQGDENGGVERCNYPSSYPFSPKGRRDTYSPSTAEDQGRGTRA